MKNKLYKLNETTLESTDTFTYDAASRLITSHKGNDQQAFIWWRDQEKFQRVEGTLDRNTVTCLTEVNRLTEPVNQIAEHEHKAGQKVIQNDIWAHPTALNQICARALEGDKNDLEFTIGKALSQEIASARSNLAGNRQGCGSFFLDHVYAVSNDNGNIVEHYRYTAFGEPEIYSPTGAKLATSSIDNTILWNSRRYDIDTNLYYYKYRHYKADIGRWLGRDSIEEDGGINLYCFVGNEPLTAWDSLGLWKIYDTLKNNPNYRLELSISALTRKFNLPRVPIVHDTLKVYGIVISANQTEESGKKCVEVSVSGFGSAGALKRVVRQSLLRVPIVKKIANKIDADVIVTGGIKVTDCCDYKTFSEVKMGGSVGLQITEGYGVFGGNRPGGITDFRTGKGGRTSNKSPAGIRGAFVGIFGDFSIDPSISGSGLSVGINGGVTGFAGYRGDWVDFRVGGSLSGKADFDVIPKFQYKGGNFDASFL